MVTVRRIEVTAVGAETQTTTLDVELSPADYQHRVELVLSWSDGHTSKVIVLPLTNGNVAATEDVTNGR